MPTAFTHAFTGASLAAFAPPSVGRVRLALGLSAVAMLPDLDVIGLRLGIPYGHPLGHRGFTHSMLFAALLAPLGAAASRAHGPWFGKPRLVLVGLFFAACASHGLLDALTDAGLGIGFFVPFSGERFFLPWRPILTSPLSVRAFLEGGRAILINELLYIWLPTFGLLVTVLAARAARLRRVRNHR